MNVMKNMHVHFGAYDSYNVFFSRFKAFCSADYAKIKFLALHGHWLFYLAHYELKYENSKSKLRVATLSSPKGTAWVANNSVFCFIIETSSDLTHRINSSF
jgi:hypothetical protein